MENRTEVREKQCYICWESNDSHDNPIRRDCECRGDNGHAHIECLVMAAKASSRHNPIEALTHPWKKCNQCQQEYTNPTKDALLKEMHGNRNLAARTLSAFIRVIAYAITMFVAMSLLLFIGFAVTSLFLMVVTLFGPFVLKSFERAIPAVKLSVCAVLLLLAYYYRNKVKSSAGWFAKECAHIIVYDQVVEFWVNENVHIAVKAVAFGAMLLLAWARVRDVGWDIPPFQGMDRFQPGGQGDRIRRGVSRLAYIAKEAAYTAMIWTATHLVATAYLYALHIVTEHIVPFLITQVGPIVYPIIAPAVDGATVFYHRHKLPVFVWLWECRVFDDAKTMYAPLLEDVVVLHDIKGWLPANEYIDLIVNQYKSLDPAPGVATFMESIREEYFWCCA